MSHSRTHQAKLARRLARETGVGYQQALQQVQRAADEGLLPAVLDATGMADAIRLLTGTSPSPAPQASPAPNRATPTAPPEEMNGFPVLEARPLPDKPGRLPGYAIVCDRRQEDPIERYVAWTAVTADGGATWRAGDGFYTAIFGEALRDLDRRAPRPQPAAQVWTEDDYRLSESMSSRAVTHSVLAIEQALPDPDQQKVLDRFRSTNLNGAAVADILDILSQQDAMLEFTEPFYESGAADEVSRALGWPEQDAEDADFTRRPSGRDLYATALRGRLIGHSTLAVALLTDAVPDPAAVTGLVTAASRVASARWPGGDYLDPDLLDLLRSYAAGTPVIWDAQDLYRKVLRLAELGLVEPVNDGIQRIGPAYRITPVGSAVLAEHDLARG